MKRSAAQAMIPGGPVVWEDDPGEFSSRPDPKRVYVSGDQGEPDRPAGTVAPTVGAEPALPPKQTISPQPRPGDKSWILAVAAGALALLATSAFGFWLLSGDSGRSRRDGVDRGSPAQPSRSERVADGSSTRSLAPAVNSSRRATFDVATLYGPFAVEWNGIATTADGRTALIGGRSNLAEFLSVETGNPRGPYLNGHGSTISDVAITPDGRRAAVGTYMLAKRPGVKVGGTLRFWDLKAGKLLFPMAQPYEGHVIAVAISADGRRGLSAGIRGELSIWDLATGESRPLVGQEQRILPHTMAFFPDGTHAATGGHDKLVHIWDVETGRELAAWTGHDQFISGLAISSDGRRVVTGSGDGTVILWDAERGEVVKRFEMPPNDRGAHVAFDPEGNIVAAGHGMDGSPQAPGNLIVWDSRTYALLRRDERPFARHLAVAALPGGRLLTGDWYAIRIWSPRQVENVANEPQKSANRGHDRVNLLAQVDHEPHKSVRDWEVRSGKLLSPPVPYARLQLPYAPPREYRIDMKVELVGKQSEQPLGIGLIVGGRQTEIGIDWTPPRYGRAEDRSVEPNGRYTGVNGYEGVPLPYGRNRHKGQLLFPSRPVQLSVTVGADFIRLTCDGSWLFDWNGDPRGLIRDAHWNGVGSQSLFLSSNSSILVHEMILTPLAAAAP
jgi:hypothetical protein